MAEEVADIVGKQVDIAGGAGVGEPASGDGVVRFDGENENRGLFQKFKDSLSY
jgi:hypothetical protein